MAGKGGTGQACAACKFQRRKCSAECPLSPYFPPDQPKQFLNAHKLFGVSNILRILKQVDDSKKSDAMKSIIYQANAREKDPVHGCFGIIIMLQTRIERLREELELVRSQLMFLDQVYQSRDYCNVPQKQQQQQLQLQSLGNTGGHGSQSALPTSWICPYVQQSPYGTYDGNGALYRQSYDLRPNKLLVYNEHRDGYNDSKDAYESSAESSLKDSQSMEHVADRELKSAAALFTLTSQN